MLQINMADVMNVIGSLTPYLIAIGVLFALALIITFAVNKKTVKDVATRKIVHSESWLVALVGIVVAVSMMLTGPLSTLLNNATTTKYMLSDTTVSKANELAKEVQSEAITMLKNDDSNLPLSNKKVNVFGWGSTNPVYGGTGSGSMSDQYETVSMLDGMKQAGIETNSELTKLYTDYRKDRPMVAMWSQDWTLPEVPAKQYSDKLISDAKDFSDEAVITITRVGGEGADLPTNMKAKGITYNNNSKDYEDFKDGEHFLQLSQTERDMIDLVTSNFKKVTLVYNGANAFQFDFLSQYPQIKSVLWCPPAGQTGFSALGEVLAGDVNPSGKTSDTFLKNLTKSVSYNNFGKFEYTNMADKAAKYKGFTGDDVTAIPGFVNYSEGIYVGYKFYETAADEGLINYDDTVMFPFGYGLSYTSFDQKLDSVKYKGGKVTVTATPKDSSYALKSLTLDLMSTGTTADLANPGSFALGAANAKVVATFASAGSGGSGGGTGGSGGNGDGSGTDTGDGAGDEDDEGLQDGLNMDVEYNIKGLVLAAYAEWGANGGGKTFAQWLKASPSVLRAFITNSLDNMAAAAKSKDTDEAKGLAALLLASLNEHSGLNSKNGDIIGKALQRYMDTGSEATFSTWLTTGSGMASGTVEEILAQYTDSLLNLTERLYANWESSGTSLTFPVWLDSQQVTMESLSENAEEPEAEPDDTQTSEAPEDVPDGQESEGQVSGNSIWEIIGTAVRENPIIVWSIVAVVAALVIVGAVRRYHKVKRDERDDAASKK